jgi:hypothetical protein
MALESNDGETGHPMSIRNPYAVPGTFRKAQLHCHTTESDGRIRPRDLLAMYRNAGYAFVCITDHNHVTRCTDLDDQHFQAIPGTEDTVSHFLPVLGPHMGRLFVDASLQAGSPQERIDRTLADGGIVSLCHPSWNGNLWTGAWTEHTLVSLRGFQILEVWNPHSRSQEDTRLWEAALRARGPAAPVWGAAVDDCHRNEQFNHGWISVKVPEISASALQRALRNGAFYASTGAAGDFSTEGQIIIARLEEQGHIQFVDSRGIVRSQADGTESRYALRGDEQFVRVEVRSPAGKAWSQPFWLVSGR